LIAKEQAMKIWQNDEIRFFVKNVNKMTDEEIASYLKRTIGSVVMMRRKYRLLKSADYSLTVANLSIGENNLRYQILGK